MRNGILSVKLSAALLVITGFAAAAQAQPPAKMGPFLRPRAPLHTGWSEIIVQGTDAAATEEIAPVIQRLGGVRKRSLSIINGTVVRLPNEAIAALASHPRVNYLSSDRVVRGVMERTGATVGATAARQDFGYDGAGIGVAVIDSGAMWHDDLWGAAARCVYFVDYVNAHKNPYDDHGHGTHVAGIIAGNGFDSAGARSGIAPAASLVVLKVLDKFGPWTGQRCDCRARPRRCGKTQIQHPRGQLVSRRLDTRVVRPRSADGCRTAGRGSRTRCRRSRRQQG